MRLNLRLLYTVLILYIIYFIKILQDMNYFTKSLCNKAAKLQFINLDYANKYLEVLRKAKNTKEESTLNKVPPNRF